MKGGFTLLVLMTAFCLNLVGQNFSREDIKVSINGLSDELKTLFEENIDVVVEKFNQFEVPQEMKPIIILVSYKDGKGSIQLGGKFSDQLVNDSVMGRPLAKYFYLFIPWRVFNSVSSYLTTVALQSGRSEILKFEYALTLMKENKDWLEIYANSRGFYSLIRFAVSGKEYEAVTISPAKLNQTYIFSIGETVGLDGKENANHTLCNFLGLY